MDQRLLKIILYIIYLFQFPPFCIAQKGGAKKSRPLGSLLENYVSFHCLHPNSQTPFANFQNEN